MVYYYKNTAAPCRQTVQVYYIIIYGVGAKMNYTVFARKNDGTDVLMGSVNAINTREAHEKVDKKDGITRRVYPTTTDVNGNIITYNVIRGALQVATTSAKKTVTRTGGTDTQRRIANELISVNIRAGADGAEQYGAEYVLDMISNTSHDSQDIYSCAEEGILTAIHNGADIAEQYHNAYLFINRYIMKQRGATARECSLEYTQESGGDIVPINAYIARIINGGERYTPFNDGIIDTETAERLGAVLSGASALLTPRQKDIVKYIARGYSIADTAERLNIKSKGTVAEHLTRIRSKMLEYIASNAPQFLYMIDSAKVNAAAQKKKRNAEYYREYRAKRKNK